MRHTLTTLSKSRPTRFSESEYRTVFGPQTPHDLGVVRSFQLTPVRGWINAALCRHLHLVDEATLPDVADLHGWSFIQPRFAFEGVWLFMLFTYFVQTSRSIDLSGLAAGLPDLAKP